MKDNQDKGNELCNSSLEEENISIKEDNSCLDEVLENESIEEEEEIIPSNREKEIKELLDSFHQDPKKLYNVLNKITKLENKIINLKQKNNELIRNNLHNDTKMKQISFIGKRKFTGVIKEDKDMQITELLKEKSDLQELNEKMLEMLTEKEIENQDLQVRFENYKKDMEVEMQHYIDTNNELETKLSQSGFTQEDFDKKVEDIIEEYNTYKLRIEESLKQSVNKEEELTNELEGKEKIIEEMKYEMESLEIENNNLKRINEQNIKIYNNDITDLNLLSIDNEKLKNEVANYKNKVNSLDLKIQKIINSKDEEIESIKRELEDNAKNFSKQKEEKNNQISELKTELNSNQTSLNMLIKKNEAISSENNEIKNNILNLEIKLDKKIKELQELSESTKKLLENKDNIIKEYENKIEELNKDKTSLIGKNHELLDRVKTMDSKDLGEILAEDEEEGNNNNDNERNNYEISLLRSEIKSLKEQIQRQSNDLLSLDSMEKEVQRLKTENEQLSKDYKNLKLKKMFESDKIELKQYKLKKYTSSVKKFTSIKKENATVKKPGLKKFTTSAIKEFDYEDENELEGNNNNIKNKKNEENKNKETNKEKASDKKKDRIIFSIENICNITYKQKENLMKEKNNKKSDDKASEKKIKMDENKIEEKEKEIERLYTEIIDLKAKYADKELEYYTSIAKYNNFIKSIQDECRKLNIKIDVNFNELYENKLS